MFERQNIIVLDLEVEHDPRTIEGGWRNKAGIGLSIGAFYAYDDDIVHWFDQHDLVDTITGLVNMQPLMVSFNGIGFDFALMRAVVRHTLHGGIAPNDIEDILQRFKELAARSYDILAEVWAADSAGKYERGLNSLDALLQANGLGHKTGSGEEAPHWWQQGAIARVVNYCRDDVLSTKRFFEYIAQHQGHIERSNGPLAIRYVTESSLICAPP